MKFRKFLFILPLVGGILTLIGLFVPAWYSITSFEENLWIVGIIEHIFGSESVFEIMPTDLFIPNITTTIIISVSSLITILSVFLSLRGKVFAVRFEFIWLMMGIIVVCTMLIYIYAFDMAFYNYTVRTGYSITNFWEVYDYNFGLIIPFIGGSFVILGVFTNKKN